MKPVLYLPIFLFSRIVMLKVFKNIKTVFLGLVRVPNQQDRNPDRSIPDQDQSRVPGLVQDLARLLNLDRSPDPNLAPGLGPVHTQAADRRQSPVLEADPDQNQVQVDPEVAPNLVADPIKIHVSKKFYYLENLFVSFLHNL